MNKLLLTLVFAPIASALANGGGYVYGTAANGALGLFQPKNAQQIEMQTENLQIDLGIERARVQVEYTLHNPGKAITAEIGFPCKAVTELMEDERDPKKLVEGDVTPPLQNFTARLDSQPLEVRTVRGKTGDKDFPPPDMRGEVTGFRHVPYWYAFKLNFASGQTRKLRVSYETAYHGFLAAVSEDAQTTPETFTYLFSTAAVWKGPIREGKVAVRAQGINPDHVKLNLAKRFERNGAEWTWSFKDFEPTLADDLHVVVRPKTISFGRPIPGSDPEAENPSYADFVNIDGRWTLHHRDYDATASSSLPDKADLTYGPQNLSDLSGETAWVEGAKGDGIGETLQLKLRTPRKLSAIALRNGYCKTPTTYQSNARVAELGVSINGGEPFSVTVPDERLERHYFEIPVPPSTPEVQTIDLKIQKVYSGTRFQDTCISELELVTPLEKEPKITPAR